MITEMILSIVSEIIKLLLNLIPAALELPNWGMYLFHFLHIGFTFFPIEVMKVVVSNYIFWTTAEFAFHTKNWVYTKLRG